MDHRWVCLTLFLALLAGMTRGQECQDPLGMESGSIPDDSITASSWFNDWVYDFYDDPATEYPAEFYSWDFGATWYARLNGDGWAPTYSRVGEWLQVDLGEMKNVKGTITLGSPDDNFYVTSYKLQYSTDETTWTTYADTDGSEKVFPGNTDRTTPVTNLLDNPIGTRYVRFLPQTWRDYPVLRVEILGCAAGDTVATTLAPTTTAALTTGRATSVATTLAPTSGGPTTDALTTARDVDECAEEADNCSPQATCSDTPDSFTCTCNPGYTGNGVTCTDVDECASNNGGCGQTCTNNAGSFVCSCGTGYILNADGLACDDVDECASNNGGCGQTCTNNVGSFVCSCGGGYVLNADGLACDDVDECANNNGGCGQTCTNNVGSFVCSCGGGYILNADGLACDDVDECASNNGGCEGTCTNNVGSFDCACGAGLVLNADGLACDTCADLYPGLQPSHNFGIYQNQCFWAGNFRTPRLNYMAAKQACQAQGGTLAMIKDEATQTFLSNHLKTISGRRQRRFWIGLDDLNAEKAFLWNDGTPLGEYDLFRSSAPHRIRDCVTLYKTRRMARWDIKNCDFRYPYICQLGGNGSK
ncbi:latent-transforming growth factor beta-binding protein 2-like isoform X3 [Branchiostoma floridae]|nr:latent-transforming growth factor beta-binding protein 2-like isoform X3 [Branchiostoma floridae]XP_035685097.1 latent-transforming growth factor beta-binding protein 2-like isoform X3 [Branchiostoma floridae]